MESQGSTSRSDVSVRSKRQRTKSASQRRKKAADEKRSSDITTDSTSMPTTHAPPCAPPKYPATSTPSVTGSSQRDQSKNDGAQEETPGSTACGRRQPARSFSHRATGAQGEVKGRPATKTLPASVPKVVPTSETTPAAPVPEAAPSAATAAAAPDTISGTRNASMTSTHSGPGTSRASRPSAASLALPKRRQARGAAVHSSVLAFLAYGACAVLVVGTFVVVLILYKHSARENFDITTPKVEQYCHTKDCEQHAQLILSKVDMNVDPCEDFNAFACLHWEPQGDSYANYGAALDSEAFHDWFTNFKRSLGEGSAHLQAGARALAMFGACLWHRTTAEEAERGKRLLREVMSKMRIPWPDEPSGNVDPLGVLIDLSYRQVLRVGLAGTKGMRNTWQLGLWFELGTLQLQPRPDPSPHPDSPRAGAASGGPTKSSGNGSGHRPLLMSPGRFVGFWSVHNSEIAHRRNYIKYWTMFYEAFGAGQPKKSDAYIRQLAAVERDVLEEFLVVVNNENKEPARFQLSDIDSHTPNLPASRWIEQLGVVTLPVVARNESGYEPNDTLTVTDTTLLRAVNRLFGTHNSTMLLRHLSWFFIQVFGALADRDLLVAKYGDKRNELVRRHMFCATEVEDAYGPLVPALYVFPRFTARIRFAIDDTFATITKARRVLANNLFERNVVYHSERPRGVCACGA
ncbi:hypothetical protein MTO96_010675 [Rhipicephalus appendiculatus]